MVEAGGVEQERAVVPRKLLIAVHHYCYGSYESYRYLSKSEHFSAAYRLQGRLTRMLNSVGNGKHRFQCRVNFRGQRLDFDDPSIGDCVFESHVARPLSPVEFPPLITGYAIEPPARRCVAAPPIDP
jgi:hypothetical protein